MSASAAASWVMTPRTSSSSRRRSGEGLGRTFSLGLAPFPTHKDIRALGRVALREGYRTDARVYVILFDFMLRAADELWPLQRDGYRSPDAHSRVLLHRAGATIDLRHRKNCPHGDSVSRRCVCSVSRLCGACALRALVEDSKRERRPPHHPLLGARWAKSAQDRLTEFCLMAGLPRLTWHSFRRGGASHLLRSGSTVAQVLTAGGWRSAAVLRYLKSQDVDARAAFEVALEESDSD